MKTPHPSRRLAIAALCCGLLAACQSPPARPTYPDLHYTDLPPIRLDVAAVDVRDDYQPPFKPPNVEQLFPVAPGHAAENWARDRLKSTGSSGRARFVIRTASAVETELPKTGGMQGAFTNQQAQRYDLKLQADLQIIDERGLALRTATVQVARSQTVPEGVTPNEREKTWYDMTKDLMADFDRQMSTEIRNNFGLYLLR